MERALVVTKKTNVGSKSTMASLCKYKTHNVFRVSRFRSSDSAYCAVGLGKNLPAPGCG